MDAVVRLAVLTVALLLDRLFGDPAWLWSRIAHPVAAIGWLIGWMDGRWNLEGEPAALRRSKGAAAVAVLLGGSVLAGVALQLAFAALPFGLALEAVAVAILLAQGSLVEHVRRLSDAVAADDLPGARQALAQIVGRDVSGLDESAIARAGTESLAENFSDGVVAPTFWYVLLGLPGLLAYKAVNTADSMIGHRSPRHLQFGWAAARLDDLLNLFPARFSALMIAAAALPNGGMSRALRAAWRDAPRHVSPNAGWPEAAAAGALEMALGGPRTYAGRILDGAWLNEADRHHADAGDLRSALRLIDRAWAVLLILPAIAFAIVR